MANPINTGTRAFPLQFAKLYTELVNQAYQEGGKRFNGATYVTNELLQYWFDYPYSREFSFHQGQKQAILNTIYAHEILQSKSVLDYYQFVANEKPSASDFMCDSAFLMELKKEKYNMPKYCMKMATGTGKTWVMHALLIWQYLNAKEETEQPGRYSKNFLLVAPGLIVYERLLDAFLGKLTEDQTRDFAQSDYMKYKELFIPPAFRELVFGFVQSNVVRKEEIGRKVTGEGLIAITNWHLLVTEDEENDDENGENFSPKVLKELLPITPGTTAGHSLEALDRKFQSGSELEYLRNLPDLVNFNDEAHHIHESKQYSEIKEVEWQKSLTYISETKKDRFIQIDFSATPFDVTGGGQNRTKHYFPHIIVNFDLFTAMSLGLVKTVALDRRKELGALPINFKAEQDESGKPVSLSEGQRLMLRAGLTKLKLLEESFSKLKLKKHPKMFVICEDTSVSPMVVDFLQKEEGLKEEDIVRIDSDKKGNIPEKEWKEIKQKLFNIDNREHPKVIVSVLMLREGFDVNNICVIVPLRSASAEILLEQTIGRGLRLMWREPEYQEDKAANRRRLLVEKTEPLNWMDILHIVEHPRFIEYYQREFEDHKDLIGITTDPNSGGIGDWIVIGLKENYEKYDLFWPVILKDKEELLDEITIDIDKISPFTAYSLEQLKRFVGRGGERFISNVIKVNTQFGEYEVSGNLFTAESYNEFLGKLVNELNRAFASLGGRSKKIFPFMQFNQSKLAETIDLYIRKKLFNCEFNPFEDFNWKVLLTAQFAVVQHLIKELSSAIYRIQQNTKVSEAVVEKRYFSEIKELRAREKYCLTLTKTIYEKVPYPSHSGGLEKRFMEFIDNHSDTLAFIKINEYQHTFAKIYYIRSDGLLAPYSPDFLVKTKSGIYIVETKADQAMSQENVKQKQFAAIDYVERVNELNSADRMDSEWAYVLLDESTFDMFVKNNATPSELFEYKLLTREQVRGTLF